MKLLYKSNYLCIMNSSNKRKILIGALMIISQILLTGFVLYWLTGQYNDEEKTLRNELSSQFKKSQDQVFDSLLVTYVINPVLKDSIEINLNYKQKILNHTSEDTVEIRTIDVYDQNLTDEKKIIALKVTEDSCIEEKTFDTMHFIKGKQEDILTRSIKLIVAGTKEMQSSDSFKHTHFPAPLDTSLLKKVFSEKLNKKGLSFDLEWIADDVNDSVTLEMTGIFLDTEFPDGLPAVNISQYGPHLLGLMIPQFLFAFLLLGLSGFAFYFTYKNLKKQIMLNKLRNDFISNITHELKTPVSTILVASEALKKYDLKDNPKVVEDYLSVMKDEAVRLDGLISKVMDHTKLESKTGLIKKERTDLNSLISVVIEKVKLQSRENNIKIDFYPISVSVWADVDPVYISGVIFNLLDNSIKYACMDSVTDTSNDVKKGAEIKIRTGEDNEYIYLTVADNGPGISEEYLPKLFDTFFRVPKGDKHNVKGSGLGLSYAKLVMTEHGGSVQVENISDGGCMFTLKFPKSRS